MHGTDAGANYTLMLCAKISGGFQEMIIKVKAFHAGRQVTPLQAITAAKEEYITRAQNMWRVNLEPEEIECTAIYRSVNHFVNYSEYLK